MTRTTWIAAPLVFLSGFCALIYQVVWTRELRMVFGASTAASSAVIAIFIAGLGWGGLWFGRRVERSANPLAFYAGLEAGIALLSVITPWLLDLVSAIYLWSGGSLTLGIAGSSVVRLVLSTLVLGPATFLMGGTLPAIARAIETEQDLARRGVAWMYGINTLGAVAGCTLSTFVLLERFGSRTSLFIACGLNLAVAAAARAVARSQRWDTLRRPSKTSLPAEEAPPPAAASELDAPPVAPPGLVFASSAVVGFAFFLMELVWYRMLGPLLGGTIFTFGLILAVALAGIGIGSALYAMLFANRRPMLLGFAITCALEAVFIALPYMLGDRVAMWTVYLRALGGLGWGGFISGWFLIVITVVFPAALIAGLQFPMLIALLGSGRKHVGRHVGTAYAANTLGAVCGALAGGFGLMPAIGALGSWRMVCFLLAGWGLAMAIYAFVQKSARFGTVWVVALFATTIVMLQALGPTSAWRHSPIGAGRVPFEGLDSPNATMAFVAQQRRSIIWQTDGIESTIALGVQDAIGFMVNGKSDGNARSDAPTQVMGGLLGAALLPKVERAMVIGLGTGSTAGWLGALKEIQRVDVAEIEPAIRHVAERCTPVNKDVLHNPKVKIHRGDARELLSVSRDNYDVIFSEPSNPYRAGVSSLYTKDFYERVQKRLAPNGLFVQWLQSYDVDAYTLQSVFATLGTVFPYVEAWHGLKHDLLLVASREKLVHDVDQLRTRVESEPFKEAIRVSWHTEGVEGFLSHFVANNAFIRASTESASQINTDDLSPVEFSFARFLRGDARVVNASLHSAIRNRNENRPALRGKVEVDWQRIDYEREAFTMLTGAEPEVAHLLPMYRMRVDMIARWMKADFHNALQQWRGITMHEGEQRPIPIERLALAEIFAYGSDEAEFEKYIQPITRDHATQAAAIRATWLFNQNKRKEATDALVKSLESYRTDPWPVQGQMARAFNFMQVTEAAGDRELAARWQAAVSKPFAVFANETSRERARTNIAFGLGPSHPACLDLFTSMEPNPTWVETMLEFRFNCYSAHRAPLRERAAADLVLFRAGTPNMYSKPEPL